ncbi:MAG: phosphocholine cytidylyltransferase family protein [Myxococcota bacterium]
MILAAGRGSRLGEAGKDTPKCLLQMDEHRLIEHQLETLAEAGVAPVGMVVGYCADEIREVVGIRAEYVTNPRWATTNSLYSFSLARDWVSGSLVIINSDTIIHPEILECLLCEDDNAFAYDSESGKAREHMKVVVADGRLVRIGKELHAEDSDGENVGVLKLTKEATDALFDAAKGLIAQGHEKSWLGAAVQEIVHSHPLRAVDVAGLPWGEVDSAYDLDMVRKSVLPRIKRESKLKRALGRAAAAISSAAVVLLMGYLAYLAWFVEPNKAWENTPIKGADSVLLTSQQGEQQWWILPDGQVAHAQVRGPDTVRLDTRAITVDEEPQATPYVIEVTLDGKILKWLSRVSEPSNRWKVDGQPVSQRVGTKFKIPQGPHELGLRTIASAGGVPLVRVRHVFYDEDE